jgi:hypothetical protein
MDDHEDWNSKPSPGALAWLVGEALRANGIEVHQTKEKFGSIRVYVETPNCDSARRAYREVYHEARAACPELTDALIGTADYREWLFDTEAQLDAHVARIVSQGGQHSLDAWDPRFRLARALIRGENTDSFNQQEDAADGEEE